MNRHNKEKAMYKGYVILLWVIFLLAATITGCGLEDEPITSVHAIAIVHPQTEDGPAFLFASNRFLDKVFRINLENLSIKEVNTGEKPRNIAAGPDGSLVAVANENGHSVTIIDTMSLAKTTVFTGFKPTDLRFSPATRENPSGRWIAVANYLDQTVSFIDLKTFGVRNVWVGGGPTSVAFDDTGTKLAVACYLSYEVVVIDMETFAKEATWEWAPYWDSHDMIYDREHPQVVVFGKPGTDGENKLFIGHKEGPDYYDHSWDYYPDDYNGVLTVMDLADDWQSNVSVRPSIDMIKVGANPRGLIWDRSGEALITINHNFFNSALDSLTVLEFDDEGALYITWEYVVGGNPVAAALAPEKNYIAAACKNSGAVAIIDLENGTRKIIGTADKPYALAFNSSGSKVIVVHESPLMPISIVDVKRGSSKVIKDSVSMDRWME